MKNHLALLIIASAVIIGCGKEKERIAESTAPVVLEMWYHGAGNEVEKGILMDVIADFNESRESWVIELEDFPQESYNESVSAAALADNLPDIIDVDGPVMPNWAWSDYLAPLELSPGAIDDFLPGAVGRWNGEVYSVGLWDAACAIFARKSILEKYGIRVPNLDQPWSFDEFDSALELLQESGEFDYALDMGMAWTGEWYPYAFSPFLQSFGGDIVDRSSFRSAEGVLNGPEAVEFGTWWQSLFSRGLTPGVSQDPAERETGFIDGKYALQWNGGWAGLGALDALGDDVLFLPAPDFGYGPKIGAASWQFGVSSKSEHKEGANAFIEFALQDQYIAAFADGIGVIPATKTAAALTRNYAPGGALELFFDFSEAQGLLRPPTPGYVVAALVFEKALADISAGADVLDTLDSAVDEINADIEKNGFYGF